MNRSEPHHLMFDIDGTLVESCEFDGQLYDEAVKEATGITLRSARSSYRHVSDEGILIEHFSEAGIKDIPKKVAAVKILFIDKVRSYLQSTKIQEIPGAKNAIKILSAKPEISLSFATGGWEQSARLKLEHAGIDIGNLPLASSDDHYSRCEIMLSAKKKANVPNAKSITYVGDGVWDLEACQKLNWNFILVSDELTHHQRISNFCDYDTFIDYVCRPKPS